MKLSHLNSCWLMMTLLSGMAFSHCQRIVDYVNLPGNGSVDLKTCSIREIKTAPGTGKSAETNRYIFSYDKSGNPTRVMHDNAGTGDPNLLFRYDKNNRLREFIRVYSDGVGFETWERFGYNSQHQIAYDTLYYFGRITNAGPVLHGVGSLIFYRNFEYDVHGRIIKQTDSVYTVSPAVAFLEVKYFNYAYDSRGNLLSPNATAYDNKLNILRTNSVWMFISRNYSLNNPLVATQYNDHALPLSFAGSSSSFDLLHYLAPGAVNIPGTIEVDYSCN